MLAQIHISDPVLVALITSIPATFAAIVGVLNHRKLGEVHLDLDGRLSQLLSASIDKGRIAERADIASGFQSIPAGAHDPAQGETGATGATGHKGKRGPKGDKGDSCQ